MALAKSLQVLTGCKHVFALVGRELLWPKLLAAREFAARLLQGAQSLLPLRLEPACHQPVVGIDRAIAALGALDLLVGALDRQAPLGQGAVVIGLQQLRRTHRCPQAGGCHSAQEGMDHGLVDLRATDVQAVHAATIDDALVRALVARRLVLAAVVRVQLAPAVAAGGQSLQQC